MGKRELKVHHPVLSVKEIFDDRESEWQLKILAGEKGIKNKVTVSNLNRPGLLLAGFKELFLSERIQIIGETEMLYLKSLEEKQQKEAISLLYKYDFPCVFITKGLKPFPLFLEFSKEKNIPLIQTPLSTTPFMHSLHSYLSFKMAPWCVIHGTLMDVYGVGILFTGRSGIGKSECAIDLIVRGHRLVADDGVKIVRHPEGFIIGTAMQENIFFNPFVEIRGVGIVDVLSTYGVRAIRERKKIDIKVELIDWSETLDYERTGLIEKVETLMDVEIPLVQLPLNPGKNITVLVEMVSLNYLLKMKGYDSARYFSETLKENIKKKKRLEEFEIE